MVDETRAYNRLKRHFPRAHWQRLESWTGTGILDANGCLHGVENWVECKEGSNPKTTRGLVRTKVRPAQVAWEYLRRQAGGRTWVALLVGDELFLLRGHHLAALKNGVTREWLEKENVPRDLLFAR